MYIQLNGTDAQSTSVLHSPEGPSLRLDFAPITGSQLTLTSTGALRIPAVLGRVGVFTYETPWGPRRELRPPDEVFAGSSMATLNGSIVTNRHPPKEDAFITPTNWRKHAVGFVGDNVRQDGNLLRGVVTVQDEAMIKMIRDGSRREISPGYVVGHLDQTPGRWNGREYGPHVKDGEPYDCVQRQITYNSVGIGPRGWGRQGSDVALRLDTIARRLFPDAASSPAPTQRTDASDEPDPAAARRAMYERNASAWRQPSAPTQASSNRLDSIDPDNNDVAAARAEMLKRSANAWKQPPAQGEAKHLDSRDDPKPDPAAARAAMLERHANAWR